MVLHVAAPFIRFQNGNAPMLCTGMALTQPIAGSGGGYRGKKYGCIATQRRGRGFAHGSGPWAKQCIQQGRQPIRRKRCADRFKVQEQVRLIPKQRSCQQLVVLGAAPSTVWENSCMAAARDTASIPLCSTAWNDARTTGQSCHVRLSDGICLPPIRLIYFIVSRPAGKNATCIMHGFFVIIEVYRQ